MVSRICIDSINKDSEARVLEKKFPGISFDISHVYTITHDFSDDELKRIAKALHNPVVQTFRINKPRELKFEWALELGFLPGVTDNVANTTTEIINDMFKTNIGLSKVFTSKVLFISGATRLKVKGIALELINTLIERHHVKSYSDYVGDGGMDRIVPVVKLKEKPKIVKVDLNVSDDELKTLGKLGILDPDTKVRRGPLALDLDYMHAIKEYYGDKQPTDIELESIAQTWSEHCKHTIFASSMDEIEKGIYKEYIKGATEKIRKDLGRKDFCISVFSDNAGSIVFDDDYMVCHKVETHNSPSALDPFGGAITGIVGVNRDVIGFGLGAKPVANFYGFCVGRPEDQKVIYRSKDKKNASLSPKRIFEGVVAGVNGGGNTSGIPTPQGFVYFDDSYKGKPLVFAGTVGLLKRKIGRQYGHEKKAQNGDNIVVIGGRVGKDGIHGATFSSEAMDSESPATAVQIGDPITQKKFSDAIVKEAHGLYNSITDNGAGGISCSVAEMAEECGGFVVELDKVPLKYPGLQPWETWISESQERMTLAVPDDTLNDFLELMESRGTEATVIGKLNNSSKGIVNFNGKKIFDLDMEFLHDGLPPKKLKTKKYKVKSTEPKVVVTNHRKLFETILGNHNNCSFEFISNQYDFNVQNNSVIGPVQGKGRVNGVASVIKPVLDSEKGVVLSQSLYPRLSEVDCYSMAACAIDTSIRNAVAMGADVNHMALLDNFCWCSSDEEERLGQLKEAAKACYDNAVVFKTPFISGKDSMYNDFKGFDSKNKPLKISILPTLLISSIGVIDDVTKVQTPDFKLEGDLIYVIGKTKDECGGSEFYHAFGEKGKNSPKVDAEKNRELYETMFNLHSSELFSSCASVGAGGLLVTLAKMAIGGLLGCDVDISKVPNDKLTVEKALYSETQGRFIATIDPDDKQMFETLLENHDFSLIGEVKGNDFVVKNGGKQIIATGVGKLEEIYKARFKDW